MNKKHAKRRRDIKTKLMAAICMLLVSSIMMVSTTYAWFTLSTAPEVTGINTAVGANGNLEMALLPADAITAAGAAKDANFGITTGTADSTKPVNERNITWGNLVDVSNNTYYGLDQVTLYPSQLSDKGTFDNLGNPLVLPSAALLQTPAYGADGRISEMTENAQTGVFQTVEGTTAFFPDSDTVNYGVRAVGTASGLSARELAYRNARATANDARGLAANKAARSLSANGNKLAGIAVKLAAGGSGNYAKADVEAMGYIINDLIVTDGVLDQIELSYKYYLLGLAASSYIPAEAAWTTIQAAIEAGDTLEQIISKIEGYGVTMPTQLSSGIAAYQATRNAIMGTDGAKAKYDALIAQNKDSYTWDELYTVLGKLADPNKMQVNGRTIDEVKADKQPLIDDVMGGKGITVSIVTGGGVYADVADQCGDYTASVKIEGVEFSGVTINTTATMNTKSTVPFGYLVALGTVVDNQGAPSTSSEAKPMTDTFGYIIDLAFRTNAADSNLLLQADAVDRIYENSTGAEIKHEDGTIESTMGHGATMTFQSTSVTFSEDQVKNLMKSIRIVFFDPVTRNVYATAKLDVANAESTTDGVVAKMYVYKLVAGVSYEKASDEQKKADNETVVYAYNEETKEYTQVDKLDADNYDPTAELYVAVQGAVTEEKVEDNKIMSLTQNVAKALSVLVYLDGNSVTNADVSANGTSSMKGTMNLQFASSANLTPMNYTPLQGQAKETEPVQP